MAPHAILVEDALSLSLLVAKGNDFRRIGPVRFGIVGSKKWIGFRGLGVLPAARQTAQNHDSKNHDTAQAKGLHRLAPCPIACELARVAVSCGLIPACRVIK